MMPTAANSRLWWQWMWDRLPVAAFVLAILLGWEAVTWTLSIPKYLLPAPSQVVTAFVESASTLLGVHTPVTLVEAGLGLGIAVSAGVLVGGIVHHFRWVRKTLYPLLVVSQTVPVIVLAPLLVIWFGYGILPKLMIVTIACFFPVAVAVVDGLDGADPEKIKLLRSMGAGRMQQFTMVKFPSALASLFTGLRVAATYGVMAAVIAEWMGADSGLGVYIVRSAHSFRTEQVFAGIFLVSLYSVGIFLLVDALRRVALPWERHLKEPIGEGGIEGERISGKGR